MEYGHVVSTTNTLHNIVYILILEPNLDLAIVCSIVTLHSFNTFLSIQVLFSVCECQSRLLTHAQL